MYRVDSLPVVSSTADLSAITNPHTGMVASNTGDGLMYRYTGAAWVVHGLWRATTELSVAGTFSFTVTSTLRNLTIRYTARSTAATVTDVAYLRINNNSTALDYLHQINQVIDAANFPDANPATDKFFIANIPGSTTTSTCFGGGVINIQGWDAPHQTLSATWQGHCYADSNVNAFLVTGGGWFRGSGPYTTVQIFPTAGNNFTADTRVDVYGYE